MKKAAILPAVLLLAFESGFAPRAAQAPDREKKQIEEPQEQPKGRAAVRVAVDQIRVDVTVQDKDKNLIRGLTKNQFKLYEDKVLQEVTHFAPIEAPMTVVLVIEFSSVTPWQFLYDVWNASYSFVQQMRKGDWVAVVAYDIRPEILVDFTQNKYEIYQALRRLNYPAFRESNLYDTVFDTLDRLEGNEGKTAVILVSSGLDTLSKMTLGETLKRVEGTSVVIYPVSIGGNFRARYGGSGRGGSTLTYAQGDATLKHFAKATGGVAFFPRFAQQYPGIFETISLLLRHQYTLGYISTNKKKDGKFRKIKVEVDADVNGDGKNDKFKLSYRRGYRAEKAHTD
jgi:VWFA-related protein